MFGKSCCSCNNDWLYKRPELPVEAAAEARPAVIIARRSKTECRTDGRGSPDGFFVYVLQIVYDDILLDV